MTRIPNFQLGTITVTQRAAIELRAANTNLADLLDRHASGDLGELPHTAAEDLQKGEQIVSLFALPGASTKVLIVTEGDCSATCVLLDVEDFDAL